MDNRTRYEGIDGLKAYAIIGIALMHVLANGEYGIGGFVFERLIPSFTNLGASINNGENGLIVSMNGESVAEG